MFIELIHYLPPIAMTYILRYNLDLNVYIVVGSELHYALSTINVRTTAVILAMKKADVYCFPYI